MNNQGEEKRTILLAEDDMVLRQLITRQLNSGGFNVLAASDGHEGIDLCERNKGRIDLILSDLLMPSVSGLEFAEYNASSEFLPFVVYSSMYDELLMKGEIPREILKASSAAMVKLGDIDFSKDMFKESAAKYREAVTADPSQIEGHVGLGEVDMKLGNVESARKHFEKADALLLDIGEDDITMFNNIAIRHRKAGRPADAVKVLESSLKRAQGNPYILYNLGRAYMDLDQLELAEACFRDALKLAPNLAEAKMMLQAITGKA